MISLDALRVLDAIDRKGTFAAAAEELHRVNSAITYTVRKLEQDLSVQVFDRSGHRARLTEVGKELLKEGRILLTAAAASEARIKRIATGWEPDLAIAYNDLLPVDHLLPLVEAFYATGAPTRLKLLPEVLGGTWESLISGRADIVIGASGEAIPTAGFAHRPLATLEFVFAVAPNHPLAKYDEPIAAADIARYRAVAVADTSRNLPPRNAGLLAGQDVLSVANMTAKLAAQVAGLGVGYLPLRLVRPLIATRSLVVKAVEAGKQNLDLFVAWRTRDTGRAVNWFVEKILDPQFSSSLTAT